MNLAIVLHIANYVSDSEFDSPLRAIIDIGGVSVRLLPEYRSGRYGEPAILDIDLHLH